MVAGQTLQIASLLRQRILPIINNRSMPWKDAFSLHLRELVHNFQPCEDAHVEDHDKVADEQGALMLIQNREIVVLVRHRPSLQGQRSRSQIEISRSVNE